MEAQAWYQFEFFRQWLSLKHYANSRGIQIFGDIPIFVAMDSADVWTHPGLFEIDSNLNPRAVAGVPPDYFAADGQLWGNPLYDWKRHKATNYAWWLARLRASFELYDIVRVDHFRGFDEYCKIPANAANAREYEWVHGPGIDLFESIKAAFPDAKLVAEDLGIITDAYPITAFRTRFSIPAPTITIPAGAGSTDNRRWFRISSGVICEFPVIPSRGIWYDPDTLPRPGFLLFQCKIC
jgi:4-alpha-glucanotransferase